MYIGRRVLYSPAYANKKSPVGLKDLERSGKFKK
jgi:hypothetical protein